jgi:1-deoxy-D-xylulose-5-phosphate reductoisomerase
MGLFANSNWRLLLKQIKSVKPDAAGLINRKALDSLCRYLNPAHKLCAGLTLCRTEKEVNEIITDSKVDTILMAISGASALPFTLNAVKAGKTLALANKEVLVMAGEILTAYARQKGTEIRPVDSEHSAIFQAMHCGKANEVRRVILTASGGPFYARKPGSLAGITPQEAINHPTWQMGEKISIDSATLMNKALEIIEAHWLFNLSADQIKVIIHPQSFIHSLVEFRDGSMIAQMSEPDMKIPIQFALTYPERIMGQRQLDVWKNPAHKLCAGLTFIEPDRKVFPALELGYEVIRRGGTAGAVLNAANEEAVKLFINRKTRFIDIVPLVGKILCRHKVMSASRLANVLEADRWARAQVSAEGRSASGGNSSKR